MLDVSSILPCGPGGPSSPLAPSVFAVADSAIARDAVPLLCPICRHLGRPKSTVLEAFRTSTQDAKIIGSYLKENDGVYLWLQLPGLDEPRYYKRIHSV
jgi:hypothetical protein